MPSRKVSSLRLTTTGRASSALDCCSSCGTSFGMVCPLFSVIAATLPTVRWGDAGRRVHSCAALAQSSLVIAAGRSSARSDGGTSGSTTYSSRPKVSLTNSPPMVCTRIRSSWCAATSLHEGVGVGAGPAPGRHHRPCAFRERAGWLSPNGNYTGSLQVADRTGNGVARAIRTLRSAASPGRRTTGRGPCRFSPQARPSNEVWARE